MGLVKAAGLFVVASPLYPFHLGSRLVHNLKWKKDCSGWCLPEACHLPSCVGLCS